MTTDAVTIADFTMNLDEDDVDNIVAKAKVLSDGEFLVIGDDGSIMNDPVLLKQAAEIVSAFLKKKVYQ